MLKKEFDFYLKHQNELVRKYNGKYLVIVGEEVVGAYNSEMDAYVNAQKKYELGTFLIQECTPGEEAYTQVFHSRVKFA
ncbi:MAG: DUF5678 domain-containing protein [Bacteroidales bacterium]|nr:DUF5678 domain-containing protein [Bacteroidales bacterium]